MTRSLDGFAADDRRHVIRRILDDGIHAVDKRRRKIGRRHDRIAQDALFCAGFVGNRIDTGPFDGAALVLAASPGQIRLPEGTHGNQAARGARRFDELGQL